jgi:hypothetical protein
MMQIGKDYLLSIEINIFLASYRKALQKERKNNQVHPR